ncbi:meiotically up-regulated gene 184 protein-like [Heracleum sosnowskyi]|uniref:Meiotically up-regulated gene 184 protein-like n=1 Tax=Heracleum sosnowskyi TaxID=360622 RepID=A0AAD8H928_9APIA|nr:meiotically up-regulated gene 184 protein-like [Heracleum sosnowskyi]
MECNRDEATRAKDIAERRFLEKDFTGAKKFALKAQNLYPQLDGISQLLATLDIYIYSESKMNGEVDWYGVLGANPLDTEDAIRKQYRKLALILHPDKNKAKGADGAFNLISQAWNMLSDKSKRSAYDKALHIQSRCGGSSVLPGQNGFFNFAQGSNMKAPKESTAYAPSASHKEKSTSSPSYDEKPTSPSHKHKSNTVPSSSHKQRPPNGPVKSHKRKRVPVVPDPPQEPKQTTFWTACHGCKMQYEYPRMYINRNLLCPNCREPFFSFEIAPPPAKRETLAHHQKFSKSKLSGVNKSASANVTSGDSDNHDKFQWAPFSKTAAAASAAQAASVVQHAYEKVKRERVEAQAATKREEALRNKKHASAIVDGSLSNEKSDDGERYEMKELSDDGMSEYLNNMGNGAGNLSGLKQFNFKQLKVRKSVKPSRNSDSSNVQSLHPLIMKARKEILKRVTEWNSAPVTKSVEANVRLIEKADVEKKKDYTIINGVRKNDTSQTFHALDENPANKSILGALCGNIDRMPMSMEVPDSDFHDFDKYRSEKCFEENQVWAVYDNDDGMPRYYGMVDQVICLDPFRVKINWLSFKHSSDLGTLGCIGSAFSKTCGDFTVGKQEIIESVNSFSHKVKWTKGFGGCVQIYPRIGDVWCLYKNWCPEWNELTADEIVHQYDIVQILEDASNEEGGCIVVIPLVKFAGFKTVFHPHLDYNQIQRIPKGENFRFSHYIPSYLITGSEVPWGCLELDPAATPSQYLHVIADSDLTNAEITGSEERNCQEDILVDSVINCKTVEEDLDGKEM